VGKEGGGEGKVLEVAGKGRLRAMEGGGNDHGCVDGEAAVLRKYLPFHEDIEWASKSILAKIKNGNCISIIQQSFIDAGFVDFKVISLGSDNVLLHLCVEGDVMVLFNSTTDLIGNFFDDCRPWKKDVDVPYERGAWGEMLRGTFTCLEQHFFLGTSFISWLTS